MHLLPGVQGTSLVELRLQRLERQNRVMKLLFIVTVVVVMAIEVTRSLIIPQRIEAGSFVVKDHGVEEAILSPGFDGGQLRLYTTDHRRDVLMDPDEIGFGTNRPGMNYDQDAVIGRGDITLSGKKDGSILRTEIGPGTIDVYADRFSTVIGRSETIKRATGEQETSSGASIQMFKDNPDWIRRELSWQFPQ